MPQVGVVNAREEGDSGGGQILVVQVPALLHVDNADAGAVPARETPRVAGVDAVWRRVQVALIRAA